MRRTDDLGRNLGEHEDRERDGDGSQRQRELAFAEQALGDDGGQCRGCGGDERVAEQNDAQELVDLRKQRERLPGAALAAMGAVAEPVPVRRHHRGLRNREETGGDEQQRKRNGETA